MKRANVVMRAVSVHLFTLFLFVAIVLAFSKGEPNILQTPQDLHLIYLLAISTVIFWMVRLSQHILNIGVRRGITLSALLVVVCLILTVFRETIQDDPLRDRFAYYMYHVCIIQLPLTALCTAVNLDRVETIRFPHWIKVWTFISFLFLVLIVTNDWHQLMFVIHPAVDAKSVPTYEENVGYLILLLYMVVTRLTALVLLYIKNKGAPRYWRQALPAMVFVAWLCFAYLFTLNLPIIRDIPFAIFMGVGELLFWSAAIVGGQIPINRHYKKIFETSTLDMQIIDLEGNVRFSSAGATPLAAESSGYLNVAEDHLMHPVLNDLLWSTPIAGGYVVTKVDIEDVLALRLELEQVTKDLEAENSLLADKEKLESHLILLREQNAMTKEVNVLLERLLSYMRELITKYKKDRTGNPCELTQIYLLTLYIKRRTELLIKSKQNRWCPSQEVCRLILETGRIMPQCVATFCRLDGGMSFESAELIYTSYHKILKYVCILEIQSILIQFYREKRDLVLYLVADKNTDALIQVMHYEILNVLGISIETKNLDDATSLTIRFKERRVEHA